MFTDIELYNDEKQKFLDNVSEIENSDVTDKDVRLREANVRFRDNIRKYLPTCLNIINTNYNCHFSIYKVGKDYDSSFNVIETNVKKSKNEIECELSNYRSLLNMNELTEKEQERLNLATEIILTYVDDPTEDDSLKEACLQNARPKASSIIDYVPSQEKPEQEIQFNPYANQPINLEINQTTSKPDDSAYDVFANKAIENAEKEQSMASETSSDKSNVGTFFSQDIFEGAPINPQPSTEEGNRFVSVPTDNNQPNNMSIFNQQMTPATTIAPTEKKDINDLLAPMSND